MNIAISKPADEAERLPERIAGAKESIPVDRAETALGERWTMRILHEMLRGTTRFYDMQVKTGAAPNMLAARLKSLMAAGLVERARYSSRPIRFEYQLTQMGLELKPMIDELEIWANRWFK